MKVLCGITKYPNKTLKEISEKLNMNYWAVYKTVGKFKKEGLIKEINIPNIRLLNYEILVAGYGSLTKKKLQELQKIKKSNILRKDSKIFYGIAESYRGFVLGVAKNYTEIKETLAKIEGVIRIRDALNENQIALVMLPLSMSNIPILFDYSGIVCKDVAEEKGFVLSKEMKKPDKELTKREKLAMYEIVNNPGISMQELAGRIKATVQTTSKIRKKLYKEGWVIKRYIPNLINLGYEVLVFAHWHANPKKIEEVEKIKDVNMDIDLSSIVFLAYDSLEGIAIAPFKSLKESRDIISFFENFGERTGVLEEEPKIQFLSLQESIKFKNHDYRAIVKDIL